MPKILFKRAVLAPCSTDQKMVAEYTHEHFELLFSEIRENQEIIQGLKEYRRKVQMDLEIGITSSTVPDFWDQIINLANQLYGDESYLLSLFTSDILKLIQARVFEENLDGIG